MIGRMLGHYQVVQEIGAGGMGVVYKALDTHLDRFVALKILSEKRMADAERKWRFVREAKAASALNHPNIIHIYDISEDAGVDFIAMEYVDGKTIDELIGRLGLPLKETLRYAIQITDALAKAHSAGIVHRDLKPSNIMVSRDGVVKLLDFGLAKLTELQDDAAITTATAGTADKPITESGIVVGTFAYMSPEQVEGKPIDPRSDIFSFGSVLYEMTTGQKAFEGSNAISTLSAILIKDPAPLNADSVPHDLEKVILRCLRKDPARRFQNMADLRVTLEELKEDSDSLGRAAPAPPTRIPAKLFSLRRSILLLLILIAVAAVATWYYVRSRPNSQSDASFMDIAPGGNLTLLVSSTNRASEPALSPDGKMLAYAAEVDGHMDLFVGRVAGGERIRLTNDDAEETDPDFSPDGEHIVYSRSATEEGLSEVWTVPTLGGQANRVIDKALDANWSPDGNRFAYVSRRPGEGDSLAMCNTDGADAVTILKGDAAYPFFRTPAWSPDGKSIVVTRSSGGIAGELWLISLTGNPPRRLTMDAPGIFSHNPVFTPDGRGVVHESNRAGATNLWVFPVNQGKPVRLTSGPGPDLAPTVARDGTIAFVNARSRSHLVVQTLANGQIREIVTHSSYIWAPSFSPSGLELAYSRAEEDGAWHIWIVPVQGGAARQLTFGALPEVYSRFSPDGAWVLYHTWSAGPDRIWRVLRTGGVPVVLTPERSDDDQYGDVSRDGQWLAFARTENGSTSIYIAAADGRAERRLTDFPSTLPRWSPDGQWIAFSQSRGPDGVFIIRADGKEKRRLSATGSWPVWWPDGKQLGFQDVGKGGSTELRTVPFGGGPSKLLSSVPFFGTNHPFDISPDGKLLATSYTEALASDIWLLHPQRPAR